MPGIDWYGMVMKWYGNLVDIAEALCLGVLRVAVVEVEHELPRALAARPGGRTRLLGHLSGLSVLVVGGRSWWEEVRA